MASKKISEIDEKSKEIEKQKKEVAQLQKLKDEFKPELDYIVGEDGTLKFPELPTQKINGIVTIKPPKVKDFTYGGSDLSHLVLSLARSSGNEAVKETTDRVVYGQAMSPIYDRLNMVKGAGDARTEGYKTAIEEIVVEFGFEKLERYPVPKKYAPWYGGIAKMKSLSMQCIEVGLKPEQFREMSQNKIQTLITEAKAELKPKNEEDTDSGGTNDPKTGLPVASEGEVEEVDVTDLAMQSRAVNMICKALAENKDGSHADNGVPELTPDNFVHLLGACHSSQQFVGAWNDGQDETDEEDQRESDPDEMPLREMPEMQTG